MKKSWKFFAKIFGVEQSEKEKRESGYESETQEVKKKPLRDMLLTKMVKTATMK